MIRNDAENLSHDPDATAGYAYAIRSQADNLGDATSQETGTVNDEPSLTRQEFSQDAEITNIIARFNPPISDPRTWPQGLEVDDEMDLTRAYQTLNEARDLHASIPDHLKRKYPDWQTLLEGLNNGNYAADLGRHLQHEAEQKANDEEEAKPKPKPEKTVTNP